MAAPVVRSTCSTWPGLPNGAVETKISPVLRTATPATPASPMLSVCFMRANQPHRAGHRPCYRRSELVIDRIVGHGADEKVAGIVAFACEASAERSIRLKYAQHRLIGAKCAPSSANRVPSASNVNPTGGASSEIVDFTKPGGAAEATVANKHTNRTFELPHHQPPMNCDYTVSQRRKAKKEERFITLSATYWRETIFLNYHLASFVASFPVRVQIARRTGVSNHDSDNSVTPPSHHSAIAPPGWSLQISLCC